MHSWGTHTWWGWLLVVLLQLLLLLLLLLPAAAAMPRGSSVSLTAWGLLGPSARLFSCIRALLGA